MRSIKKQNFSFLYVLCFFIASTFCHIFNTYAEETSQGVFKEAASPKTQKILRKEKRKKEKRAKKLASSLLREIVSAFKAKRYQYAHDKREELLTLLKSDYIPDSFRMGMTKKVSNISKRFDITQSRVAGVTDNKIKKDDPYQRLQDKRKKEIDLARQRHERTKREAEKRLQLIVERAEKKKEKRVVENVKASGNKKYKADKTLHDRKKQLVRERDELHKSFLASLDKTYESGVALFDEGLLVEAMSRFRTIERIDSGYKLTKDYINRISREIEIQTGVPDADKVKQVSNEQRKQLIFDELNQYEQSLK